MRALFVSLAVLALSGCASLSDMHADYQCGHDGDASWRVTGAPVNAETLRAAARATPDEQVADVEGREIWFARADGAIKYCILDNRIPYRDCRHVRRGVSWQFEQSGGELQVSAPDYAVCIL